MTTLAVNATDLDRYGELVKRVGAAAKKAQSYVDDYGGDFSGAAGRLWSLVVPSSNESINAVSKMLRHLEQISLASDSSLKRAANYYRTTEHDTAAKADAAYSYKRPVPSDRDLTMSHYRDLTGRPLATNNFEDATDALANLKQPDTGELGPFEEFVNNPGSVFDYISPSNAACKLIELITGHDPIKWFIEWFDGDWKKCYECGAALDNVGKMMGAISTNAIRGANELQDTWSGKASDAAWGYFDGLSTAVGEQQEVLCKLGLKYKETAIGICRIQDTAAGIIKGMIDGALVASAAAAGGVATVETGAGPALAGLISGAEAAYIWEKWERLKFVPETATEVVNSLLGVVQMSSSKTANFARHPLPQSAYKFPMR